MKNCKHQFIKTYNKEKVTDLGRVENDGVEVACAFCAETRHLTSQGVVVITTKGHGLVSE